MKKIKYILMLLFVVILFSSCSEMHTHSYVDGVCSCGYVKKVEYVVIFKDYDGSFLKEEKVLENSSAQAPADPKREGYDFIGWSEDFSEVKKDITVIALYELHVHKYYDIEIAPTCEERGYTLHACICEDTYKDTYVDSLGHDIIIDEKIDPTCTESGLTEGEHCSRCDYKKEQEEIKPLDHSYESVIVDPTCEEKGYTIYTCYCSYSYIDSYIDELGHDIIVDKGYDATCTKTGLTDGEHCSRCDYKKEQEIIDILKHEYTSIVTEATCLDNGYTTHTCKCGDSYIDSLVDALDHDIIIDKGIEATCMKTGLTDGEHCSRCDYKKEQEIIDIANHKVFDNKCEWCFEYITSSIGLEYSLSDDNKGYIVTGIGECNDTNIVIPSTFNDLDVIGIGKEAFRGCINIKNIIIPNSITYIGDLAFYGCNNLTYNNFDNANYLGNSENPYLVLVKTISLDITECLIHEETKIIYRSAFAQNTLIKSIVIPKNISNIGNHSFNDTGSIQDVYYEGTIENWLNIKFESETSSPLQYYANFYMRDENSEFKIVEDICIPNNIVKINDYAFYGFKNLLNVEIPEGVKTIGKYAFYGCWNLTSLVIPSTVISIEKDAFWGNLKLVEIYNLSSLPITKGNFDYGCVAANAINVYDKIVSDTLRITDEGLIICKEVESKEVILKGYLSGYCLCDLVVPNDVTIIADSAFYYCGTLVSVIIPNGVHTIGIQAFDSCSNLKEVILSNSITKIGGGAFAGTQIESITLPEKLNTIEGGLFAGCSNLKEIVIQNNVSVIKDSAFDACILLSKIIIPSSVHTIESEVFVNCISLSEIIIPNSVEKITDSIFSGCENIKIYCEAESKPVDWSYFWCIDRYSYVEYPVVWGYIGDNIETDEINYIGDYYVKYVIVESDDLTTKYNLGDSYFGMTLSKDLIHLVVHNDYSFNGTSYYSKNVKVTFSGIISENSTDEKIIGILDEPTDFGFNNGISYDELTITLKDGCYEFVLDAGYYCFYYYLVKE